MYSNFRSSLFLQTTPPSLLARPLRRRYFAPIDFTRKKHYFMKNLLSKLFGSSKSSFLPFEPTNRRIKVSLHQLINDLLTNLQPLARSRNNVILNGVPQGLCFIAEENMLALKLWSLLGHALQAQNNDRIHVFALVDDHQTTISVKNADQHYALSIPNHHLAR
jgi:hypothetical protein